MAKRREFSELSRVQLPAALHLMRLGYTYLPHDGEDLPARDEDTNILVSIFRNQFLKLNDGLTDQDFAREFENIKLELDYSDLGRAFFNRLQGADGRKYIDWENPANNTYHIALEVTCENGQDSFRPDIMIFINGLPLSYLEVKMPNAIRDGKTGIQSERARTKMRFENRKFRRFNNITQLLTFSDNLPYMLEDGQQAVGSYYCSNAFSQTKFNAFKEERGTELQLADPPSEEKQDLVLRDMHRTALKSSADFLSNLSPDTPCNSFLTSIYQKERFLFLLHYGLVYVEEMTKDGKIQLQKHVMRYPQYFATRAIEDTIEKGKKKGVIWHTQGSGKTALAFFNIRYLRDYYSKQGVVPQFYFVVDRLDLADQAFKEFSKRGLQVKRIHHSGELDEIHDDCDVAVVNIQKFEASSDLTDKSGYDLNRQTIYFIDEAHRSYNKQGSYLPNLYNADENAIKIALTGTPLITYKRDEKTKESHATTRDLFGDYIHKYYYNQSIEDGFTLRMMREDIETAYKEGLRTIEKEIQKGSLRKSDIFAHPRYVSAMLDFILDDFVQAREIIFDDDSIGGMIVCDSAEQARELEKQLEMRRSKGGTELTSALILHDEGDKTYKKERVADFKRGKVDLLIVYSMLLTGFDAPRLKRLYLGRKVKAHNLLQTLTRVNRPYKDYSFGYVIDFADISDEFDKTNRAYLEELNHEYALEVTGENGEDVFGTIFVSAEEIEQELDKAKLILAPYPTQNLSLFEEYLNNVTERKGLTELKKALTTIKQFYNMARLLKHDELLEPIDISQVSMMLNSISKRLMTLSLVGQTDMFSNRTLLNLAMSDMSFTFTKIAEEELRLAAADLDKERKRVSAMIDRYRDEKDPEWVNLMTELKRVLETYLVHQQTGYTKEKLDELKSDYKKLFDEAKSYNDKMHLLELNCNRDKGLARVFKHMTQSTETHKYPEMFSIIEESKATIDGELSKNGALIENDAYLKKMIRFEATKRMNSLGKESIYYRNREQLNLLTEELVEIYR